MMNLKITLLILLLFSASNCNEDSENTTEYPRAAQIIGGKLANIQDFPFLVSLHYRYKHLENGHTCCGFLVTPSWIVTAAHCLLHGHSFSEVLPTKHFYLLASTADLVKRDSKHQKRSVKSFVPHPYFSWPLLYNDIGLIQASRPFDYNGHISLAVLPRGDMSFKLDPWMECSVAGWGITKKEVKTSISNKLRSVTLKVAPKEVCERVIGGNLFTNPAGSICTYSENGSRDPCKGDSGSALLCAFPEVKGELLLPELAFDWVEKGYQLDEKKNHIVVGVVSWSWECARAGVPAVYTDVFHYRDWMRCTVINHSTSCRSGSVIIIALMSSLLWLVLTLQTNCLA